MKKTPWFPAKVKPVRKGYYEVQGCEGFMGCAGLHYWTGENWCYHNVHVGALPWRGLMK